MKRISFLLLLFMMIPACSDDSGNESKKECEYRCVDNISYSCDSEGNPVQHDCGKLGCNDKKQTCNFTTVADECAAKAKQCTDDDFVETCSEGHWVKADTACLNGCKDGACVPDTTTECTESAFRCSDKNLEKCTNNQWVLERECPNGCENEACIDDVDVCIEPAHRCSDKKLEKCMNNQWVLDKECPNGCENEACIEDTVVCTDAALQCNDNQLEKCTNNQWVLEEKCPYGCEDNKCKPDPCDNYEVHCDGDKLMYCEEGKIKSRDCKLDKGVCKNTSSGDQCVAQSDQCAEVAELVGDYTCKGEIIVYQSCEKIDGVLYLVEHWAETRCHEVDGANKLMVCTDPKDDGVYVPYDWQNCATSCTNTPETTNELAFGTCDGKAYGGPYDTICRSDFVINCQAKDLMCVSNNLYYLCLESCTPGDPDIIRCDKDGDLPYVARKVTCQTYSDGTSGYFILQEQECKDKCTAGVGCE